MALLGLYRGNLYIALVGAQVRGLDRVELLALKLGTTSAIAGWFQAYGQGLHQWILFRLALDHVEFLELVASYEIGASSVLRSSIFYLFLLFIFFVVKAVPALTRCRDDDLGLAVRLEERVRERISVVLTADHGILLLCCHNLSRALGRGAHGRYGVSWLR